MDTISAIIITQDEERNIGRCLDSLAGIADEVVVVDSGSTDATEQICLCHGARFVPHPWEGYSQQKNYAESLAAGNWILSLDADEALSDQLRQSILQLKGEGLDNGAAYSFSRLNNYCGHWIKHCGWYPDEKVRLWPKGSCQWDGVVHEELQWLRPVNKVRLDGDLLHYSYYSVSDHAARQVKYATLAAQKACAQGKRAGVGALVIKPAWNFLRNYLFKSGFLDGRAGFLVCKMSAFYTFLKYAKLRELNNQQQD